MRGFFDRRKKGMEIKIENNLSANEYNNLRSKIGWDTKDVEVVQNAIKIV